jgi:hypothetical protein
MNSRRFSNPVADSLERTQEKHQDRRIPRRGNATGGNMGLSQSLKEIGPAKSLRRDIKAVKDDSGVQQLGVVERERDGDRTSELETMLMNMWKEGEGASTE